MLCAGHYLKSVTHQASSDRAKKSPPLSSSPFHGDKQLLKISRNTWGIHSQFHGSVAPLNCQSLRDLQPSRSEWPLGQEA